MAAADQAAAGIHRYTAAAFERTIFDSFPTLARLRDAEMVDGHVFRRCHAIVSFDGIEIVDPRNRGTIERIGDCLVDVRHDKRGVLVAVELLLQPEADGSMSPTSDASTRLATLGREPPLGNQHQRGGSIGDLGDVVAA